MNKLNIKSTDLDLSALFKNDDDPNILKQRKLVEKANYDFINKWKKRTDYLKDPKILKKALDEYEYLQHNFGTDGNEGYYFSLKSNIDQNDPKIKARVNQIDELSLKIYNDLQFFELNLVRIPKNLRSKFLKDSELKKYKHFLEKSFACSDYTLSDAEEKILNLKQTSSHSNWVKLTSAFISKEERKISVNGKLKTHGIQDLMTLISSPDKKTRDSAAEALNDILEKNIEVGEAEINSILQNKKIDDEIRKLPRPDKSRHLSDDIDSEVVDSLIKTVSDRFDISKRFYKLKTKLLGFTKMAYHERNVEYGTIDQNYSYSKGANLVRDVFYQLDPQYAEIFSGIIENAQVDVYPKKGKRGGASCHYNLIRQPSYVFLNYTNKLNDVTTLAHEAGHGIQNELIKAKQHALDFGTPLSIAEVGSQFLEDFVLEELVKKADDEQKLAIQMFKLNSDISSIFRQVACYKFEYELHQTFREKGYLSYKEIGEIFQKHMASYMGSSVEMSKGSENWWVYWSHIRRFFYVYTYASGLLISKYMQSNVRKNKKFVSKVKDFQSAGMSASPRDIFKNMGIDITKVSFWKQGLYEIEALLNDTEKLAKKLGKI